MITGDAIERAHHGALVAATLLLVVGLLGQTDSTLRVGLLFLLSLPLLRLATAVWEEARARRLRFALAGVFTLLLLLSSLSAI